MPGKSAKFICERRGLWIYHVDSSSSYKTFKVRECPLRIAGAARHLRGEPRPASPGRTLIYGQRGSELSCILVAGIKRAFSLTTDHIPGILPRENIPENNCGLGYSSWGGVRLGGRISRGTAFLLH